MLVDLGVKPGSRAGMADPVDDPHAKQRIEHAVYGRPRHPRQSTPDGVEYLFCRRMVLAGEDGLQDGPPLDGQREALPAAKLLELPDSISPGFGMHTSTGR